MQLIAPCAHETNVKATMLAGREKKRSVRKRRCFSSKFTLFSGCHEQVPKIELGREGYGDLKWMKLQIGKTEEKFKA